MKKGIFLSLFVALLMNIGYAQKLSKDEAKHIKDELKNYMKHPEEYKAKMDALRADKDSSDAQMGRLRADLKAAQDNEADMEKRVAEQDEHATKLQEENDKLKEAATTAQASDMKNTPKGTVYKVQLGMYRGLNVNKSFEQARYIGYEDVNGMNRYVISSFPDQETALKFVADIRKLGIHDAFVAKYIDGTRVFEWSENPKYKGKKVPESLDEALGAQPAKKGKKGKKADQLPGNELPADGTHP